jgi:phenylpropionate dioxygenase-like ring-hydroxylating dioxygenase large terminal subunit
VPAAIDARRPVSIFVDDKHFALEQDRVFRRLAVPVTVSAMLPAAGGALAHEGYGVPLVLTRGKDGRVRAFLNACQHKGAKLINDCEPHQINKLSCPYHSWTYGLDGKLVGVARPESFKDLCKEKRGLAELDCQESGGLVWVSLNRHSDPDFSGAIPELADDLTALGIPTAHVYGRRTFKLEANWKLVLEPFLEGYHIHRLHAKSIANMFNDGPNVLNRLGRHSRQVSGKANFSPELLDAQGENIHKAITFAYQVFPNTVIITSPYYISVMIIMPNGASKSTVEYFMLTPGPPETDKAKEVFARSYEIIQKVFGTEDFWAAEISQAGLASGALDEVVYSGLEANIPKFYETLESLL